MTDPTWRYDLLFGFSVTAILSLLGAGAAWLFGNQYPEGIAERFLVVWIIMFVGIVLGLRWDRRRDR